MSVGVSVWLGWSGICVAFSLSFLVSALVLGHHLSLFTFTFAHKSIYRAYHIDCHNQPLQDTAKHTHGSTGHVLQNSNTVTPQLACGFQPHT